MTEAVPNFRSIFNSKKLNLILLSLLFIQLLLTNQNHNLEMSRLYELVNFISKPQVREDPFWRTVLTSDSRSIFPKYELVKIQLAKCHMNKLRLITEDLPSFLSLPLYAQKMQKASKANKERDVGKELDNIKGEFEKYQESKVSNDYQFEVLEIKDKVEYFCTELSKPKIKEELKQVINKHPKWKQYLKTHLRSQELLDPLLKEKDKCQLASVIELSQLDDCLLSGTAGKIIEERVREEVMQYRLKQIFEHGYVWDVIQNDPYEQEWQAVLYKLNKPVEQSAIDEYV